MVDSNSNSNSNSNSKDTSPDNVTTKPARRSLLISLLGAAFGVQSSRQLEQDFSRSTPWPFIVGGLLGTALFVLGVWWLVHQVMARYA